MQIRVASEICNANKSLEIEIKISKACKQKIFHTPYLKSLLQLILFSVKFF